MSDRPQPQPGILDIAPYVPGKSGAGGPVMPIKLSSNESPLGASPRAVEAYTSASRSLAAYPDGASTSLREALAEVHGLEADRIIVGAGSDELLNLIAHAYLGPGDEAVISQYGFLVYPIATKAAGATPVFADDEDYTVSVDNMLAAVTEDTKVVWLANPNNPTGTWLPAEEVRRLHQGLRPDILFVVDNAYAEYVTADDYEDGTALVREADNVLMVRTFSKMGLAALRLGWMYGPEHVIDAVNRIRGPFNVGIPAQKAGEAAARDTHFLTELVAHNAKWRDWLTEQLTGNRYRVLPSQGNFILVLFPDQGLTAEKANAALAAKGLIVREMGGYGISNGLRISIGTESAMRAVAEVLKDLAAG